MNTVVALVIYLVNQLRLGRYGKSMVTIVLGDEQSKRWRNSRTCSINGKGGCIHMFWLCRRGMLRNSEFEGQKERSKRAPKR